jgi:DNA processing protein
MTIQDKFTPEYVYQWLLLTFTNRVGNATINKLLTAFGTIENIYNASITELANVINQSIAKDIVNQTSKEQAEYCIKWLNSSADNYIISINNKLYPKELLTIFDRPLLLFLKGNIELLNNNKFAIVGTRHPTIQGSKTAFEFAKSLSNNGLTIVSGLAAGIDAAVHSGALGGSGSTIAIIGTGLDMVYPKSNEQLYTDILKNNGLIVTEFPLKTRVTMSNFPRRNRIIAGLSLGVLVVESAIDGGSMITANLALDMGREVMAIPGSIHNPITRGCHKLIKNGAKLVENSNDVLEELQLNKTYMGYNNVSNDHENDPILFKIGYSAVTIDEICETLNMDIATVCAKILDLELAGKIVNCGGGKYQRIV